MVKGGQKCKKQLNSHLWWAAGGHLFGSVGGSVESLLQFTDGQNLAVESPTALAVHYGSPNDQRPKGCRAAPPTRAAAAGFPLRSEQPGADSIILGPFDLLKNRWNRVFATMMSELETP